MKKTWFQGRLRWFLGKDLYAKTSWLENWAAALSFYNLLCQVPLFLVAITLAGFFLSPDSAISVRDVLIQLLPVNSKNNSDEILEGLRRISGGGFLTFTFVAAIWTSANFMNQMLKALHFIMGGTFDAWTGAWSRRLKSFVLLIIWISKMLLNACALLLMPFLAGLLTHLGLPYLLTAPLANLAHQLLLFVLTFGTFYLTYRLASSRPIPSRLLCEASALAALGWIVVRTTFMKLLPFAWQTGVLAGTVTSMMALLLLAYAIAWVILLGGCWIARNPNFSEASK